MHLQIDSPSKHTYSAVFFPNLNGIRGIAAIVIVTHHLELVKALFGLKNLSENIFLARIGGLGVTLFFVLSGFLITYLLLAEKEKNTRVPIGLFYIRRVLRIWPLYYLVLILAFFILPEISFFNIPFLSETLSELYTTKLLLYLLILPNIASVLTTTVPYAGQAWSVGVEEQFYLIWPLIINKTKYYVEILCAIIILLVLASNGFLEDGMVTAGHYLHVANSFWYDSAPIITAFFKDFRIGCMAIGGLGAYILFFNKTEILKMIFSRKVQIFIYAVLILMLLRGTDISHEFYSFFFVIVVLNMAANHERLFSLENPVFDYIGKISYGLYMLHHIAIIISIRIALYLFQSKETIFTHITIYVLTYTLTILIATVSYYLMEKKFMKLKAHFSRI